jgi:hypothetical protein
MRSVCGILVRDKRLWRKKCLFFIELSVVNVIMIMTCDHFRRFSEILANKLAFSFKANVMIYFSSKGSRSQNGHWRKIFFFNQR